MMDGKAAMRYPQSSLHGRLLSRPRFTQLARVACSFPECETLVPMSSECLLRGQTLKEAAFLQDGSGCIGDVVSDRAVHNSARSIKNDVANATQANVQERLEGLSGVLCLGALI